MEREQKRTLALGIIIGLVILISVIYFFWGSLINRGTLSLIGDAPFSVEIFNVGTFECPTSPCKIKQKIGLKDLLIKKEGYKELLSEADVKLWRTVSVKVNLDIIPKIEKLAKNINLPQQEPAPEYKIIPDSSNGMQKLIATSDGRKNAIVYFPNPLVKPSVIGGGNKALIISQTQIYLIDLQVKTKEKIENQNLLNLKSAKWSKNGEYLLFETKDSPNLWLLTAKNKVVEELSLSVPLSATTWNEDSELVFATDQGDQGDGNNIKLLSTKSPGNFIFGIYSPITKIYKKFDTFSEIKELPTGLFMAASNQYLYFRSAEENFKIILRKI